jgi:Xaa-Pro aminopeptidase
MPIIQVIWRVPFSLGNILIDKSRLQCCFKCKKRATKMLVPGTLWKQYHIEVGKLMTSELLGLGLIDKPMCKTKTQTGLYKIFHARNLTPHGTRHPRLRLNLCKLWYSPWAGIYIPAEGFGIRLEDDVVIQTGEPSTWCATSQSK